MVATTTSDAGQNPPKINGDLQDVARGVHQEFDKQLDPTVVSECLERLSALFAEAKVRSFVPLLVRRYASDELRERVEQGHPAAQSSHRPIRT